MLPCLLQPDHVRVFDVPPLAVAGGRLLYEGTEADEQLSIWSDEQDNVVVWINGVIQTFAGDTVQRFDLLGGGGNDLLKLNPAWRSPLAASPYASTWTNCASPRCPAPVPP